MRGIETKQNAALTVFICLLKTEYKLEREVLEIYNAYTYKFDRKPIKPHLFQLKMFLAS